MSKMGIDKEDWRERLNKLDEEIFERDFAVVGSANALKEHADVAIVTKTMYLKARDELAELGVDPEVEMLAKMAEVLAR